MNKKHFFDLSMIILGASILSACTNIDNKKSMILWGENQQMILVLTSGWNVNSGVLLRFQYKHSRWVPIGSLFPVSLGKNGIAWGQKIYPSVREGEIKTEGDFRSPAGIFQIGYSFGYAQKTSFRYPYRALTKDDYCIDNSQSPYYNQIINHQQLSFDINKNSTEPMRRDIHLNGDQLYKWGFVLRYNPQNIPKAGSCIFVHLRTRGDATTAGCISMEEENMRRVLGWLKQKFHPVFVLLPMTSYQEYKEKWNLPEVNILLK